MIDGRVSMAVATPAVPLIAPPSTAAYSSAGGVWLMSRGIWGDGLHGAWREAVETNKVSRVQRHLLLRLTRCALTAGGWRLLQLSYRMGLQQRPVQGTHDCCQQRQGCEDVQR